MNGIQFDMLVKLLIFLLRSQVEDSAFHYTLAREVKELEEEWFGAKQEKTGDSVGAKND